MVRAPHPQAAALSSCEPAQTLRRPPGAGFLYHQKDMLQDRGRMNAYRNAIMRNPGCFQDKVRP